MDDKVKIREYEGEQFETRLSKGLLLDRSREIHNIRCMDMLFKASSESFEAWWQRMFFRANRNMNSWHVKRQVNAEIVDLPTVHSQLVKLAEVAVLDLLMSINPTTKDLKNLPRTDDCSGSGRNEKSVRRTQKDFSHVIAESRQIRRIIIRNPDRSYDKYPKIPSRKDPARDDKRLKSIVTPYSLEPSYGSFDTKSYADANYLRRLKKFWKSMLELLVCVMERYGPIRKEMDWLIYHIVNNDNGLHVLFDNLSLECEEKWFGMLGAEKRQQIAGLPWLESEPYIPTPDDAEQGISELRNFVNEFEVAIPSTLKSYKVSQRVMKRRMYELALYAADGYHKSENLYVYKLITNEIEKKFERNMR